MRRNLRARDRGCIARDSEPDDLEVARSDGGLVIDARGRRYVDFSLGWNVGNLGWTRPEIRRRMTRFDGPTYVEPGFLYRPWVELAELLVGMAPGPKLTHCFRAATGTEAVEAALQAAMAHTERRAFVSVEHSYHGNSVGAKSVGASDYRERVGNLMPRCHKIEPPLDGRAAERVERLLRKRDVAAFIMEPVLTNLGVLIPEREFMERVREACRERGTLFVMDEVSTGFGRTGRLFATEHYGIEPDVLCLGKSITGGCAPLATAITSRSIARSLEFEDGFYSTYGWHPLAVEAAIANLQFLERHRERVLGHVEEMGRLFRDRLSRMKFRGPGAVRSIGLAIAVEFEDSRIAEDLRERCREAGLLVTLGGESAVVLFPPLNVDQKTARLGLDVFERCAAGRHALRKGA